MRLGITITAVIITTIAIVTTRKYVIHKYDTEICDSQINKYDMEITIKGMNCNHCRANAEKAILSCDGVTSASVDLTSGKAQINGNADINEIRSAVEALGFSVES